MASASGADANTDAAPSPASGPAAAEGADSAACSTGALAVPPGMGAEPAATQCSPQRGTSPRVLEACSPRRWPESLKAKSKRSDGRMLSCSPAGRSEATLCSLRSVRLGYTSPRLRSEATAAHRQLQSPHDAAWDGDTEGLAALLAREEGAVDLDRLDYLQRFREGLCFDLAPAKQYQMQGFALRRVPDPGRRKYAPFCATPLMFAVANNRLDTTQWLLGREAKTNVSAELVVDEAGAVVQAGVLDIAFAGPALPAARAVKAAILEKAPAPKCAGFTKEQVALWMEARGVVNREPLVGRRWTPAELTDRHNVTGQRVLEWVAQDWRSAGFDKLRELQKLFRELFRLLREGYTPPGGWKLPAPAPAPAAAADGEGNAEGGEATASGGGGAAEQAG
eukprot:TRINITY_DN16632_c0_g1_i1.p1 TRINITY_DN16632_c0_g1~~TRINITY_DN16632_c0_g1_i1.p1  ORF type:complete len:423 (+),score=105.25 TRINITY_DN16632_c0_g1_i1:88-1269(+)